MKRWEYMLIRCAERRRLVEVFVKKVWKCPLSREPNGTDCLPVFCYFKVRRSQ